MKRKISRRLLCLLLLLAVTFTSGCKLPLPFRKQAEEKTSLGVDDGIGGFLYNFDERPIVADLVANKSKGIYPESVTWYYRKVHNIEEEMNIEQHAVTSRDPAVIEDIYYMLSNTIIVGIAHDQSSTITFFISFQMPDGQECRFSFPSANSMRISGQNYVIESDGSLWKNMDIKEFQG